MKNNLLLPWTVKTFEDGRKTILNRKGECPLVRENADIIVEVFNSFEAIRAALLACVQDLTAGDIISDVLLSKRGIPKVERASLIAAIAALALAKGKGDK